jgi:peptidyl-prolyl cis-trans isomerase C
VLVKLHHFKALLILIAAALPFALQSGTSFGAGRETGATGTAGAAVETAGSKSASEVLARVNGSAITRAEVDRAIVIYLAQSRLSHELSPEARKEAENGALEQLIGARLLYQNGLKLGNDNLEQQVEEKLAQSRAKFPSANAYLSALKSSNLTELEAREIVRNDIVITKLLADEVVARIIVPDSDISGFYLQNKEKFNLPERLHISHILIEVEAQAPLEEKLQARGKAEAVRKRILAGEDFAALARSDSSCPSKEEGGDLGVFAREEMIPEFLAPLAELKVGEISPVVQTAFGFHILKLTERKSATVRTLDESREQIESHLKQARIQQAIIDYVSGLKKAAQVELTAGKSL